MLPRRGSKLKERAYPFTAKEKQRNPYTKPSNLPGKYSTRPHRISKQAYFKSCLRCALNPFEKQLHKPSETNPNFRPSVSQEILSMPLSDQVILHSTEIHIPQLDA